MNNLSFLKFAIPAAVVFATTVIVLASCIERIEAGYVGIRVNLVGSDRGVADVAEVTGYAFFNPFTQQIYEFPIFVQNVDYSDRPEPGQTPTFRNAPLRVTTSDGLTTVLHIGLAYRVDPDRVPHVFKTYRKPLPEIQNTILRKEIQSAFSTASQDFSSEESYAKKSELKAKATELLQKRFDDMGFEIDNIVFLQDPVVPEQIQEAIQTKVRAQQIAQQKEAELRQAEADGRKLIAAAQADSTVRLIAASAQAQANDIVSRSITSALIEMKKIEKWDGKNPNVVTEGGGIMVSGTGK